MHYRYDQQNFDFSSSFYLVFFNTTTSVHSILLTGAESLVNAIYRVQRLTKVKSS